VIHDSVEMLSKLSPILRSLHWSVTLHQNQFLVMKLNEYTQVDEHDVVVFFQLPMFQCILNQN
jgi:hypothetical protein